MRVLVAPDSFGGWMAAPAVAQAIGRRLHAGGLVSVPLPMGDGGEGTAEVLAERADGAVVLPTGGPLGDRRGALCPLIPGARLFVESSHALGPPTPETRAAWGRASSEGLASLLSRASAAARDHRASIVVGLGGSATVDGGLGLARGLGLRAEDARGRAVLAPGAQGLAAVARLVGPPPALALEAWADVQTPLLGAVRDHGPQKGVPAHALQALEDDLRRFAGVLSLWAGREIPLTLPGGGAAGGVGFALHALLGAPLVPGAGEVAAVIGLDTAVARCDAVVTGEGRLDATSLRGKVVGAVIAAARGRGVPVVAVVGDDQLAPHTPGGPDAVFAAGATEAAALDAAADAAARWITCR